MFLADGEPRMRCTLFPRNVGDPVVATGSFGVWGSPSNGLPVRRHCVLGRWERTTRRTEWYRQAKATKCGETDGRKS
jgi:hypothetical protein